MTKIICNNSMKELLTKYYTIDIQRTDKKFIQKVNTYEIPLYLSNEYREPDIYLDGVSDEGIFTAEEWGFNESFFSDSHMEALYQDAYVKIRSLAKQMKEEFSDTPFEIICFFDSGDEDVNQNTKIHFHAIRKNGRMIKPEELDDWGQPMLVYFVNMDVDYVSLYARDCLFLTADEETELENMMKEIFRKNKYSFINMEQVKELLSKHIYNEGRKYVKHKSSFVREIEEGIRRFFS